MATCMSYDEDLTENLFFQTLRKEYTDLFYKVILEGCVITVPRVGSLPNYIITLDDILGHILLPSDELPETHFNTLNGKEVTIFNRMVTLDWDVECQISTSILFEETYYTEDMLKYKVVCLEHPLEPKVETNCDGVLNIATLRDCMDFINGDGKNLTKIFDKAITDFLFNKEALENASLQTLKELTFGLYAKCCREALNDRYMKEKTMGNPHNMKNLKLAVETYVHHGVHKALFKSICTCLAEQDAALNKIIRNCSDVQSKDLEVRAEFHDLIPKAKTELVKLNGYGTVMGKIGCLRKMLSALAKDPEYGGMLAADDLLPIIIFILMKVNITDWHAHLNYLKHFRFSSQGNNGQDEEEFLVTTIEAALEHIESGVFLPISCADNPLRSTHQAFVKTDASTNLDLLYEYAATGDLKGVQNILECAEGRASKSELCHPLCVCEKCGQFLKLNVPTISTKDNSGSTVLHIAASFGQPEIVDYLISLNAEIDETDSVGRTPLHYAALRGHQSVLLLLLQCGADINASDNLLNTPLHLSTINGHLTCVKALIYHCEHEGKKICINAQNNDGNTPLHHACLYGYLPILQLLVSYDADPSIVNRRKISSFQVANNSKVYDLLTHSRPKFKCCLNVKTINFDFLEEGTGKEHVSGELPVSVSLVKKVDKMFRAITHGDVNFACYYLGLGPIQNVKKCHPLCVCLNCKGSGGGVTPTALTGTVSVNMCDSDGQTALHIAVQQGLYDFSKFLVTNGALVDIQTRKLVTPLIIACQQQRTQLAAFLLECQCSVNLQDNKGNTALHYACMGSQKRIVELLLKYKPKLGIKNKSGRSALQEAEARLSFGIVNLLKQYDSEDLLVS